MLITVKTFNGHNINDSNYRAVLLNQHTMPEASPVFLDQSNADSVDAGVYTVDVQNKTLSIKILNYANRYNLISQLKSWFKRGTQGNLVVTFRDDGQDYQISARVVNLVAGNNSNQNWTAILQTGVTAWRAVTETTEPTWTVTGTTETLDIDVAGQDETFLSVDLSAVAVPSGTYQYQNLYRLPNTPGISHWYLPWCITVNTAALVAAGKMRSDCNDLRIVNLNTGQELKRWIVNPNNAGTKVWINIYIDKGASLTLATSVAGAGAIDKLEFVVTDDTRTALSTISKTGVLYHGNEWFAYSNPNATACTVDVTTRGLFGTTIEAHNAGVAFLYIQNPLVLRYGNPLATDPAASDVVYDVTKPVIDLANSSNTSWVWGGSYPFALNRHSDSGRSAEWMMAQKSRLGLLLTTIFVNKQNDPTTYPSTYALGFSVKTTPRQEEIFEFVGGIWRDAGITSVTMTGEKYRSDANWPDIARVQASPDALTWTTLFSEASPASDGAWANWTNNSTPFTPPTGSKYIWVVFSGTYPGSAQLHADFELLTCTLAFNSSNIPTGAFLGETSGFAMAITIENETTGDLIYLKHALLLNKEFSIDGETGVILYDGYNAFGSITMDDESRPVYIRLSANATNTIRISGIGGSDLGQLSVDLSWYTRRL